MIDTKYKNNQRDYQTEITPNSNTNRIVKWIEDQEFKPVENTGLNLGNSAFSTFLFFIIGSILIVVILIPIMSVSVNSENQVGIFIGTTTNATNIQSSIITAVSTLMNIAPVFLIVVLVSFGFGAILHNLNDNI